MSGERPVLWTADEAATATAGRIATPWQAAGVSIDSRTVAGGDLFIAIAGPSHDGHDFVADALAKGAAAAMVSRIPPNVRADAPLLLVADTMRGLVDLARAARERSQARVIAVTGSVGKTGVKEVLRLVLARQAETSATEGSLNNHWGLPLSLARLPRSAHYAVYEMGMNHPGEIAPLSRLAQPDVAVITTVDAVHKAYFTSTEAIADAKAEICTGVRPGAVAVLNRDNAYFERLAAAAAAAGVHRIISFGRHPEADVRPLFTDMGASGSRMRASSPMGPVDVRIPVAGTHWITNSLCVLAAAAAAEADVRQAAAALADFALPKGRGRVHTVNLPGGVLRLIDDSYNASPVSMAASIEVLGRAEPAPGGRRIAVLGDMLELGDEAVALHRGLAGPLRDHGIDLVFTAGPMMAELDAALPAAVRGAHADSSVRLAPLVAAAVHAGDVVAVKGSAGSRMGEVMRALLALELPEAATAPGTASGRAVNGD